MIAAKEVWGIIRGHVPKKQWVSSGEICAIVEMHGKLDEEDRKPHSSRSALPRWKTLVRSVLSREMKSGNIRSRKQPGHFGGSPRHPEGGG
jgi:hypothetical protein